MDRALTIDKNLATAWASLAYLKSRAERDWTGAQAAINRARQLEPNNTDVLGVAATLAKTLGQFAAATALLEQSVILDPLNLSSLNSLAYIYMRTGRFDEAIETINRMLKLYPEFSGGYMGLSRAYLIKGDPERALVEIEKVPTSLYYDVYLARIYYTLGNEAKSQAIIKELLATSANKIPGPIASIYAWRGENDLAFEWFELALQQQDFRLNNFLGNEWLKGLESDPRYPVFLEKLGLLEAWKAMPKSEE